MAFDEQILRSMYAAPWRAQALFAESQAKMFGQMAESATKTADRIEKGEVEPHPELAEKLGKAAGLSLEPEVLGLLQTVHEREEDARSRDLEVLAVTKAVGRDVIGAGVNTLLARGLVSTGTDADDPNWLRVTQKGLEELERHGSE